MSLDQSMEALSALGDPTRLRLLAALELEELTVAELQRVLDVPQPRVSTHLARLKEAGFVLDRTAPPHRYYRLAEQAMSPAAQAAWSALKAPLAGDAQLEHDRQRLTRVLRSRASESWVDRVAGSLDRHYSPGRTWETVARGLVLLSDFGEVIDLGAGDGAMAELLAPRAQRIVCVDSSAKMIEAGRRRFARQSPRTVELLHADMHAVPLPAASFDTALLQQSLQYAEDPAGVIAEAARLVRPGGRVLAVTLAAHRHVEVRQSYGHLHLGFRPAQLRAWMAEAGLEVLHATSAGHERRPPQFETIAILARRTPSGSRRPRRATNLKISRSS